MTIRRGLFSGQQIPIQRVRHRFAKVAMLHYNQVPLEFLRQFIVESRCCSIMDSVTIRLNNSGCIEILEADEYPLLKSFAAPEMIQLLSNDYFIILLEVY